MEIARQIFRILIFSNGIIALASVAQSLLTYLILRLPINPYILLLEGCSTITLYSVSLFLAKPARPMQSPFARTRWFFSHEGIMYIITAIAFLVFLYAIVQIHHYTLFFLVFVGFASLLYNIPILRLGGNRSGFRQIPGLKIFHIAVVWSLSTVGIPVVEAWAEGIPIDWFASNYLGSIKILFLIICTLPFDVRDIKQDSYYNLKTIPIMIGKQQSIRLTYLLLALHSIIIMFAPYIIAIKCGLLLTNLLIVFVLRKYIFIGSNSRYHTAYLLDLALVAQCILVALGMLLL